MGDKRRVKLRMQGGPFDGKRYMLRVDVEPPARVWVRPCAQCGSHVWPKPFTDGEPYRRDIEQDGHWLYVFTDDRLGDGQQAQESELVPAGFIPNTGDET